MAGNGEQPNGKRNGKLTSIIKEESVFKSYWFKYGFFLSEKCLKNDM